MSKPIRTKRIERDYSKVEAHKLTILRPATWGTLMQDSTPLGSRVVEGRD
jgi:hypothetical protein